MFSGITSNNIDSKGRIVLPARFREELGDSFIITRGFLDCIQVLSIPEFEGLRKKIKEMPANMALKLQYRIVATAVEVSPNSQGRISIPANLRKAAGLEKTAAVVGMDSRVEIWNEDKFNEMVSTNDETMGAALELLML
ncbi:MAG: division/cell wall cluster transcriptional repressor MraZ [Ruminococcus sp.]|nr:division/cell wall cluster transcriptional repressor MraZ [Ruminococcus sp.]